MSPATASTTTIARKAPAKTRAGLTPRSKTGCVTCKAKHSKCDETRPTCKRCASKGLACGGYPTGIKWTFKQQVFQAVGPEHHSSEPQPQPQPQRGQRSFTIANEDTASRARSQRKERVRRVSGSASGSDAVEHDDQHHRRQSQSQSSSSIESSHPAYGPPPSTTSPPPSPNDRQPLGMNQAVPAPRLATSFLNDTSSAFIINWFQEVCPAWSGFDSNANWNRKMAIDLWQTSATVNSALESMSASFLASRLPGLRPTSLRLMQRATDFIQAELEVVKRNRVLSTVPKGLLFAMFCLGTTVCWVDARGLGLPFFRESKTLLTRLNAQAAALGGARSGTLDFFNKSMVYCEMLLAVVRDDGDDDDLECEGQEEVNVSQLGTDDAPADSPRLIHPWTGISMQTSRLFAESVRICRTSRHRTRRATDLMASLHDFLRAQRLEEQLLALEFNLDLTLNPNPDPSLGEHTKPMGDTGDLATPKSHLALTAEAYRLSSLLHLYQTFPDLSFHRLPAAAEAHLDDNALWTEWIVPLALHLLRILERIPPSSGSRCIHPLLYISASTGLRHSTAAASAPTDIFPSLSPSLSLNAAPTAAAAWRTQPRLHETGPLTSYITQVTSAGCAALSEQERARDLSLEVSRARHFVMRRLESLESSLPPAPVVVAKELVAAVWAAYDGDVGGALYAVHWIDVMEDNDLRSMFG